MIRLARPLDRLKPHYDVVVVGSGYGGGVAASRLARAGKRVAVLERGREFVTGEFPSRFPDLRGEMQLTGKRMRLGSATGLYDVRLGEDMHVLIGCGLGGGSLPRRYPPPPEGPIFTLAQSRLLSPWREHSANRDACSKNPSINAAR